MLTGLYIIQCNIQSFILAHNWQLVILLLTYRFNFQNPLSKSVWCFWKMLFFIGRENSTMEGYHLGLYTGYYLSWCALHHVQNAISHSTVSTYVSNISYTQFYSACLCFVNSEWCCSFAHIRQGNAIGTGNSWWYKTTKRQTTYSKLFSFVICIMLCQINLSAYVELWYHSHYYCRMHQRYLLYIIGRTRTF